MWFLREGAKNIPRGGADFLGGQSILKDRFCMEVDLDNTYDMMMIIIMIIVIIMISVDDDDDQRT